ncbi:hypothetical protein H4219_005914 [Mycoemilia scoparia]|uniref:Protein kinase domain-containing protein n=1 Tax=Mycoemilia scoparia TaxID=417184 RepID=A0A9W8DNF2_9FUNG|nr:hypothetical protein H4219_005914 [Mycoemilia scoparia]
MMISNVSFLCGNAADSDNNDCQRISSMKVRVSAGQTIDVKELSKAEAYDIIYNTHSSSLVVGENYILDSTGFHISDQVEPLFESYDLTKIRDFGFDEDIPRTSIDVLAIDYQNGELGRGVFRCGSDGSKCVKLVEGRGSEEDFRFEVDNYLRLDGLECIPEFYGLVVMDDHGGNDDERFVVGILMESIEGVTIKQMLEDGIRVDSYNLCELLIQYCREVTERGVVLTDIKSSNVMFIRSDADGEDDLRLIDFGGGMTMGKCPEELLWSDECCAQFVLGLMMFEIISGRIVENYTEIYREDITGDDYEIVRKYVGIYSKLDLSSSYPASPNSLDSPMPLTDTEYY